MTHSEDTSRVNASPDELLQRIKDEVSMEIYGCNWDRLWDEYYNIIDVVVTRYAEEMLKRERELNLRIANNNIFFAAQLEISNTRIKELEEQLKQKP